jgi:hypothetical protein
MENTRRQQAAADSVLAGAVLALGTVLVVAGRMLAGDLAPGASGDWLRIAPSVVDGRALPGFDVLLGLVASVVGLAVVVWWLLSMALAVIAALMTAAGARRAATVTGAFAPAFMRRLALAVLGASLVATPAAHASTLPDPTWQLSAPAAEATPPAHPTPIQNADPTSAAPSAAPSAPAPSAAPDPTPSSAPDPTASPASEGTPEAAWVPAAPLAPTALMVRPPTRETPVPEQATVEVRPGDSLWSIVARTLGPGASELEIAAAWPDWYEANRGVIGEDPDLIRPGQLLTAPR